MIYYFGWIAIHSNDDSNVIMDPYDEILEKVNNIIKPFKKNFQLCELRQLNYLQTLFISSAHNHDVGYSKDVISLFEKIGKLAADSYGLLYLRFPEDSLLANEFIVYRLAKGKLTRLKDIFLSPCIPTIENE